jgi:hypothetical protein
LERVIGFGSTTDGASHLASIADVLIGSFRYCVNEEERDIAGRAMFPDLDYRFRESCHKQGIHLSFQAPMCAGALRTKD